MLFLMLLYLVLSVRELGKRHGLERKKLMLLSMAGIAPAFMLTVYLTGILDAFDPVPIGIVISCTLLTLNVVKYGLLDTMQLAKEQVIENTKEGLVVIDPNYHLLYANEVAKMLFPKIDDAQQGEKQLREIFEEERSEEILELNGKNYEIRISKIMEDNHLGTVKGYLAWIFDMSFINRYTEEMIRLRQEAEKANLAKSSFLAHMSHEIRTPMNAILGFADLCLRDELSETVEEYVENIKISAETLLHLINQILDISKIESGKMELVDMRYAARTLMSEIVSTISQQVQAKNLTFRYMVDEKFPSVLGGDKMRVREIAINLLSNAVKYTDAGTIMFKIKEIERKDDSILMEIIVKDSGIGIKEEDRAKLFEKFEQFDRVKNYSQEGTGLGLAIVKNLVDMMNGSIDVESTYGEGSTFRARVWQKIADDTPIGECRGTNQNQQEEIRHDKRPEKTVQFPGVKALVVDDNVVNLKVAYGILKLYGIEADLAGSGQECLKLAAEKSYELIFMDQMMPEMDGVETLKKLREKEAYRTVPVIALTANTLVGVKEEMIAEGFNDFLGKPMDLTELEKILRQFAAEKCVEVNKQESREKKKAVYDILLAGGIAAEEGEHLCGGLENYKEALRTFVENSADQQKKMKDALEKEKLEEYRILVHALKSSAAAIGAQELSQLAKTQENEVKEGKNSTIKEEFELLCKKYEEVLHVIENYLTA
jgi:signal transduction histidine kinase/FixJ family two-component response regulator/HPt (histidine-containing phosphotransfer) domain-containing protein